VTTRKALAPKEIRFLRDHMELTQAQLGAKLRGSDQTVARWEKGETKLIPGAADIMLRVLFLASPCAQPEGQAILEKLIAQIDQIVESDEPRRRPVVRPAFALARPLHADVLILGQSGRAFLCAIVRTAD
jgi:transcriptional regulator with XRE-family HTH domain